MNMRMGMGMGVFRHCGSCGTPPDVTAFDSNGDEMAPVVHEDGTKFWVFTQDSGTVHVTGTPVVDLLLVAGGGAGGGNGQASGLGNYGGGGGGGRVIEILGHVLAPGEHDVSVGAGATYGATNGGTTFFDTIEAMGGGTGGTMGKNAYDGGCGGGGGGRNLAGDDNKYGGNATPGDPFPGDGYKGGNSGTSYIRTGAGGGGAGSEGKAPTERSYAGRGKGGNGETYARFAGVIEDNPTGLFAGGGEGSSDYLPFVGADGEGSHGFGGAGGNGTGYPGSAGGSGIVIIRMEVAE